MTPPVVEDFQPSASSLMERMPSRLWTHHILPHLDYPDLKCCQRVSKRLKALTLSPELSNLLFRTREVDKERLDEIYSEARECDDGAIRRYRSTSREQCPHVSCAYGEDRPTVRLHPLISAIEMKPGQRWNPVESLSSASREGLLLFTNRQRLSKINKFLASTLFENACEPPVSRIEIAHWRSDQELTPPYANRPTVVREVDYEYESDVEPQDLARRTNVLKRKLEDATKRLDRPSPRYTGTAYLELASHYMQFKDKLERLRKFKVIYNRHRGGFYGGDDEGRGYANLVIENSGKLVSAGQLLRAWLEVESRGLALSPHLSPRPGSSIVRGFSWSRLRKDDRLLLGRKKWDGKRDEVREQEEVEDELAAEADEENDFVL